MKIRVYSPYFPFPVTEGAYLVISDQLRHLVSVGHEVELVYWKASASAQLELAPKWAQKMKVTFLETASPEGYCGRIFRVLSSVFSPLASSELFHYPPQLSPQWTQLSPVDLAIYHYSFSYAWLRESKDQPVEKTRAVHFHNLESTLFKLRADCSTGGSRMIHRSNARKLAAHEERLSEIANELWFLSPVENAALAQKLKSGSAIPSVIMRFVPPTLDPTLFAERTRIGALDSATAASERTIAGFIGALNFEPNRASAEWILDEVAPKLAAQGFSGKIIFVGRGATSGLKTKAAQYPFVDLTGFIPNLDKFWESLSFLLVPHLSGAGVRTKALDAIASGVPVLANEKAAETFHPDLRQHPLLQIVDHATQWTEILMREAPRNTRKKFGSEPFCTGLEARNIYSFLG